MIALRRSAERGLTETDWLRSWHTFSFGEYRDRQHMGFGPLRVINEDIVAPAFGFPMHGHADMEIITYILSGALEHKDSLGSGGVIRPGEVQVMSAGKGILHSEFNPSPDTPVHLLQIWIMPEEGGGKPSYQQKAFDPVDFRNRLRLIVSPDGAEGSLTIRQQARIWAARLDKGAEIPFTLDDNKKYWLQAARGKIGVGNRTLGAGDALALDGGAPVAGVKAVEESEFLFFEMPA